MRVDDGAGNMWLFLPGGAHGVRGIADRPRWRLQRWQRLTLVHCSAQLEPCLTHKNTLHTLHTPNTPLTRATQPLHAPAIPQNAPKLSRKVDECKPLSGGSGGGGSVSGVGIVKCHRDDADKLRSAVALLTAGRPTSQFSRVPHMAVNAPRIGTLE
jgi:hypothetical protein